MNLVTQIALIAKKNRWQIREGRLEVTQLNTSYKIFLKNKAIRTKLMKNPQNRDKERKGNSLRNVACN